MKRTAFSSHNELYVQYLKSENKHNMSVQHINVFFFVVLLTVGTTDHCLISLFQKVLVLRQHMLHVGTW